MKRLPIFADHGLGEFAADSWKLLRWTVADGEGIATAKVIAEVESEKCVCEIESYYFGVVRHIAKVGETVVLGTAIAEIEVSDAEYQEYLRRSPSIELRIKLGPEELDTIEKRRGLLSRDDYITSLVIKALKEE